MSSRGGAGKNRRRSLLRVAIPLADQGIVSAGTFLFNILLARAIPLGEYGNFAIILGIVSLMQTGCSSILFYPLAVRAAPLDPGGRRRLILSAQLLTLAIGVPLAALLAGAVWTFVDRGLFAAAMATLLAGQIQEAARRGLLSEFRYGAATIGDAVSYIGQTVLLLVLCARMTMTLENALWIMATTSMLGAAVQIAQGGRGRTRPLPLGPVLADFWSLGHWSLTSNLLGLARTQSLPWLLAVMSGPAAAGAWQIAINLVNVVNPIIFGVCNIVPQTASQALRRGYRAAWEASWLAIGVGLLLVLVPVSLLLLAPGSILSTVYGARADATLLAWPVRVLALAALINYAATTVAAYLQGVAGGRDVLVADVASTLTLVVAAPLLLLSLGLDGGAAALAIALALRAGMVAYMAMTRVTAASKGYAVGREIAG